MELTVVTRYRLHVWLGALWCLFLGVSPYPSSGQWQQQEVFSPPTTIPLMDMALGHQGKCQPPWVFLPPNGFDLELSLAQL